MDAPNGLFDDADDALLAADFRLSVDSNTEDDDASPLGRPMTLPLPLPALDAADASLWNLVSPCSDDGMESQEFEEDRSEPEASPREATEDKAVVEEEEEQALNIEEEEEAERYASSSDSEDEEVEVFNAETEFFFMRRSSESVKPKDDMLDSVTEADELEDLEVWSSSASSSQLVIDDSASEDGNSSTSTRPSFASGRWVGRMKARTYSGPASMKMHEAYDKLRARTLSATATLRHAARARSHDANDEDDGGFSSDDEDYDRDRASRVSTPKARATSLSFPTRLSHMQLPTKMSSMMRFRSSSIATTSSEDSFLGSNDGSALDSTLEREAHAPSASAYGAYSRQELKHKAAVCASRAAGILGAASAEAARKLRTTRAFRSSSQPSSIGTPSPVIDRQELSPGRPPLPVRTVAASGPRTMSS